MDAREQMIHLLRWSAWNDIQSESLELAAIIRAGVAAGKTVADILSECAAIEPDRDILDGAGMAIEYLREEEFQAILRRAQFPSGLRITGAGGLSDEESLRKP